MRSEWLSSKRPKADGRSAALGVSDAALPAIGFSEMLAPDLTFTPVA